MLWPEMPPLPEKPTSRRTFTKLPVSDKAARLGSGAPLCSTVVFFCNTLSYAAKISCFMLSAPFLPPAELSNYHGCLTQRSRAQQSTATPFLAAPVQPRLLLSNLVHFRPGKNQAAKDSRTTRLHLQSHLAHPKPKNCSLKLNLQCHRSRWFSFFHP